MSPTTTPEIPALTPLPVSVVILCYKSERFIECCLDGLAVQTAPPSEILVIDNDSGDEVLEKAAKHLLHPRTLQTGANLGFAGGNNAGWPSTSGEVVLFLNPDCILEPACLEALVRPLLDRPREVGVTGAKLLYPHSHVLQHAGGVLHPNAMTEHRGMGREDVGQFNQVAEVPYVTGAALAIRRDTLDLTGGFDEDFFPAYYEESDLCLRVRRMGLKVLYLPHAVGYHLESPTVGKGSARFVRLAYRSRIVFLIKNKTLGQWLGEVIPFEWDWMRKPYSKGFRLRAVRSYGQGLAFALKCLARMSRRPTRFRTLRKDRAQRPHPNS